METLGYRLEVVERSLDADTLEAEVPLVRIVVEERDRHV
jgi:hypothetical protein